ncbi:hypothetical protein KJ865_14190, partial [Myxococcota bacterium]|nr:hypothetical protein [Myxococcota bacterium]
MYRIILGLSLVILVLSAACDDSDKKNNECIDCYNPCDDGITCNGAETYDATADACLPGISPCLSTEFCDPAVDLCVEQCPGCRIDEICYGDGQVNPTDPCLKCDALSVTDQWSNNDGAACDDGLFCTINDTCLGGTCDGSPMNCDDGVGCNGVEACDEGAGACIEGLTTCDATEFCHVKRDICADWCYGCVVNDVCYGDGQVNPANPCLICDLAADPLAWSLNDGVACDDGLACTIGDICLGGTCDSSPLNCDDSVACNGVETCDE